MNMVSKSTVPRDLNELKNLNRSQLVRLALQLGLLDDDAKDQAFKVMTQEQQAQEVLNALLAFDAAGGAPQQVAPPPQPMQGEVPPGYMQQPQQPPPQYQQPQYQQPPQQQYAPPPAAQPMPPQAAPPPLAPPPQVAPPMPPPMPPPQAPHPPPNAGPPAPPPTAPQAPYAPPPPQPMAPGGYPMPPQPAPQPQYQAPPPQMAAPVPPPPPMAPPQQPPPQMPPQAPMRQPQTASDPSNAGAGQGVADTMKQLVNVLGQLNQNTGEIATTSRASVTIQRVILKVLLTLAEQQGISSEDLAKLVRLQDDQEVEKFVGALGNAQGKS